MNALMKQAQAMQTQMLEEQEKLKQEVVDASAGGGMVKVKMSGDMRLLEVTIQPDAIDPEDAELLQDMVMAAVNEGIRAAQDLAADRNGRHHRRRRRRAGPAGYVGLAPRRERGFTGPGGPSGAGLPGVAPSR